MEKMKREIVVTLIAVAVIAASLSAVLSNTTKTTKTGVVILDDTSYISLGDFHLVGEVKNNLPANVRNVKIMAIFYDEDENIIRTDYSYTMLDFLEPNQKSPFDLCSYSEKIEPASYELSVTWVEAPFEGLEIIKHNSYIDSSGYHKIGGSVKNNGSEEAESVEVV